jgi:hypothetical protein
MSTEDVAPSKVWTQGALATMLDNQGGIEQIHLVIIDLETKEVVVTSRFRVEKNGKNLTFIGTRDNPKFSEEQA